MARTILHLDLDAFFCAVEELQNPNLKGKAFAVGGDADARGVVSSASYPARVFGVRSAMPMGQAKRLCPELLVVPARHKLYSEYSGRVMAILAELSPLVEQLSIDEAFLDVTGIKGSGDSIARQLRLTIRNKLGLPCSLGVASNKLIAKLANNMGKARNKSGQAPCAIEVVEDGQEAAYLAPLPVIELWGVGPKTAEQMQALGIHTIGDIAKQSEDFMLYQFGKIGFDMLRHARGIDSRPVEPEQETKSISSETTFNKDERNGEELRRVLRDLAENVGRRLRASRLRGRTIGIKLRWSDFTTISRQFTLNQPTQDDLLIAKQALDLFAEHWPKGKAVRLIGVAVSNFEEVAEQLSLWEDESQKRGRKLQNTLDELKERFGDKAIQRGSNLSPKKKN
jgi:DNA polymerase IV